MKKQKQRDYLGGKLIRYFGITTALLLSTNCFANYSCGGTVSYLGIGEEGVVTVAFANSTPIHKICNVVAQGNFRMAVSSCKLAYAALLTARVAGKSIVVYYNDNGLTCGTLPSWGEVTGAYFVQGPE